MEPTEEKREHFCNVYFVWRELFLTFVFYLCIVYWINFQNIYTLHIKKLYFIHFCYFFLKSLKAFRVSLSLFFLFCNFARHCILILLTVLLIRNFLFLFLFLNNCWCCKISILSCWSWTRKVLMVKKLNW